MKAFIIALVIILSGCGTISKTAYDQQTKQLTNCIMEQEPSQQELDYIANADIETSAFELFFKFWPLRFSIEMAKLSKAPLTIEAHHFVFLNDFNAVTINYTMRIGPEKFNMYTMFVKRNDLWSPARLDIDSLTGDNDG